MKNVTVTYISGTSDTTNIITPDQVRFDMHRDLMGWPAFADAPFLGLAFWAWAALKRQHRTELDFDGWLETVEDIAHNKDQDEEPNPTRGATLSAS